jgi:hypothetical protein
MKAEFDFCSLHESKFVSTLVSYLSMMWSSACLVKLCGNGLAYAPNIIKFLRYRTCDVLHHILESSGLCLSMLTFWLQDYGFLMLNWRTKSLNNPLLFPVCFVIDLESRFSD